MHKYGPGTNAINAIDKKHFDRALCIEAGVNNMAAPSELREKTRCLIAAL